MQTIKPVDLPVGEGKKGGGDAVGELGGGGGGRFFEGGDRFGGGRNESGESGAVFLVVPHGCEADYRVLVLQVLDIVIVAPKNLDTFCAKHKMSQVVHKLLGQERETAGHRPQSSVLRARDLKQG